MIKRDLYLEKIRDLYDSELIKIIVGVRRSGKSVLLMQIQGGNRLQSHEVQEGLL